jgi:hypothetical protein
MRSRLLTALVVVWWIATPSVCGAFLASASCGPTVYSASAGGPVAAEMPCHGDTSAPVSSHATPPASAPADDEQDGSCCGGIDLAASAKPAKDAPIGLAVVSAPLGHALVALRARGPLPVRVVDRLRSPYAQQSPPLLN